MKFFNFFKKNKKKSIKDFKPLIDVMSNKKKVEENKKVKSYKKGGIIFNLGDKVIARSNECNPLTVGVIVEFWNNDGRLSNCIPQIKDELDGKIKSHMGQLKPYSDELFKVLKPMRPLEQWNYLLPNDIKKTHSYSEKEMNKKEDLYNKKIKFLKNNFVN